MDLATLSYTTNADTLTLTEPYNSENYCRENSPYISTDLRAKYSDTVVIDALFLKTTQTTTILSSVVTSRTSECEDSVINIPLNEDGHILIYHLIVPTEAWADNPEIASQLGTHSYVYYNSLNNLLVKVDYNAITGVQQTTFYEISEFDFNSFIALTNSWTQEEAARIPEDFDLLHLFITNKLRDCYVQTSYKALANNLNCKEDKELKFKRDLIHMAYTVI